MKKVLLSVIALASFTVATAQDGLKGTWWAAGQLQFGSTKTGDVKTTSNTILPIVGTFISPSVTVGAGVGVMNSKSETGSTTTAESTTLIIKPLVRKYWNVKGGLFFYGQAALPIMMGENKKTEYKTTSFALELAPGFDYVVNKWLTVETSFNILSVGSVTEKPKTGDKTTSFGFNANPMNSVADRTLGGLQVGVKFLF